MHVTLEQMEMRQFHADSDLPGCLAVMDSNDPEPEQREAFASFLQSGPTGTFTVVEHAGAIVGCGGFTVDPAAPQVARLHWAMVRKDLRRKGLGRFLLLYRLKQIGMIPDVQFVEAQVPSHLSRFYEKCGLKPTGVAGVHRMRLQVCTAE